MEVILATLIFLVMVVVWVYLPFVPSLRERKDGTDVEPVKVTRDSEVDIRFFARGFREFMKTHFADAVARCSETGQRQQGRLADGSDFVVVNGRDEQEPPPSESAEPSKTVIVSCGRLRLPAKTEYLLELCAKESVEGAEENTYRAILAEDGIVLGPRSTSLRWIHAGKVFRAGEDCRLWGRVSAEERIDLAKGSQFERLYAPRVAFGGPVSPEVTPPDGEPIASDDIAGVVDDRAGRWLVKGKLEVPENRIVPADLVATGEARIGQRVRIKGSIKARKDLHLGRGVEVEGSVVGGRDIHLAEGCKIHGPVLAEGTAFIDSGCVIGSPEIPTTVSARRAEVAPGVVTHGTFWAHEEGRLTEGSRREG